MKFILFEKGVQKMSKSEKRIYNNKKRREQQQKKNICLFFITVCFVIVLSFAANGFISNANSTTPDNIEFKYYKSIAIEEGDTLWSIASKNMGRKYEDKESYINEVKKMNGLIDDQITIGSYIIIPYFSNEFIG